MIDPINQLTSDEVNQIKDLLDKISKSDNARNHTLLTINTTIFAIVVTLTSFETANKLLLCLYILTLSLFVLSIVSGYILTNMSGHVYRKSLNKYFEHLSDVKTGSKSKLDLVVSASWYYKVLFHVFEVGTYLSLISLAAFTVAKQLS
jgi:Na+/glutamate symporter